MRVVDVLVERYSTRRHTVVAVRHFVNSPSQLHINGAFLLKVISNRLETLGEGGGFASDRQIILFDVVVHAQLNKYAKTD